MRNEIWKPILGYEGHYEVSNLGRVKSLDKKVRQGYGYSNKKSKILKACDDGSYGYCVVRLSIDNKAKMFRVHRLVANAFHPNPENKPEINHKWGNKKDNRASELEWATRSENQKHKFKVLGCQSNFALFKKYGAEHHHSRPVIKMSLLGEFIKEYVSAREAANDNNISEGTLSLVLKNGYGRKTLGGFKWKLKSETELTNKINTL